MNATQTKTSAAAVISVIVMILIAFFATQGVEKDSALLATDVSALLTKQVGDGVPTSEPPIPTVTATEPNGCKVIVGQGPNASDKQLVWILRDENGLPGAARLQVPWGLTVLVTKTYIVEDVLQEWSYTPDLGGGWIRNNAQFPAYDYESCWDLPAVRPAPSATPAPTATPLPASLTPVPVECQVTPKDGTDYVNVRTEPGTWAPIVGRLEKDRVGVRIGIYNDWTKISFGSSQVGWVASWVVLSSDGCN